MELLHTARPQNSLLASLMSTYSDARIELNRRRTYSQATRALENLSDRQLQDIGVPRSQINQIAYDNTYNGPRLRR